MLSWHMHGFSKHGSLIDKNVRRLLRSESPELRIEVRKYLTSLSNNSFVQDNYTIAVLMKDATICGLGVSKRNPVDPIDETIGFDIALNRAIKSAILSYIGARDKQAQAQK